LPGLDPGIHVFETEMAEPKEDVDTRDKPAQGGFERSKEETGMS
jgi:hypothetical protein